ncbi:MAG TPA: T9SS type A sorting domain-containing protein [Cytophagaceae bacterium]|jgi:O-glycosyl hydrolase
MIKYYQHLQRFKFNYFNQKLPKKLVLCLIGTIILGNSTSIFAQSVTIDLSKTYQTITALGSMELDAAEVDELEAASMRMHWDPEYNKELEMSGNDNADPNVLDISKFKHNAEYVAKAKYAKSKGVNIFIATVWSPPGWMKDMSKNAYSDQNQWACPFVNNLCGGVLPRDKYAEYAEWLIGGILSWKNETGIDLYAVGLQNEPEFPEPYGSAVYTPSELKDLLIVVGRRFKKEGITTKIYLGEILWAQNNVLAFMRAVNDDPEAKDYLHAFAIHNYDTDGIKVGGPSAASWQLTYKEAQRVSPKKELWMTETSGHSFDEAGGMLLAANLYNALNYGNINAWNYYYLRSNMNMVWHVSKSFYKFIKPGAIRVSAVSSDTEVLSLAFKNPLNSTTTVILINNGTTAKTVKISGSGLPSSFSAFTSNASSHTSSGTKAMVNNEVTLTLAKNTVTSLSGNLVITEADNDKETLMAALKVYPNPATGIAYLFSQTPITGTVEFTNVLGTIVKSISLSGNEQGSSKIDITDLAKGVYSVTVKGPQLMKTKLVVE